MKNKLFIIIQILLILIVSACSGTKKTTVSTATINKNIVINNVKANDLNYNVISTKYKATVFINKSKNSFSGNLKIANDSLIWITVSPLLNIEVVRGIISKDSVFMINRFNREYYEESINQIVKNDSLPFIKVIQNVLIGNLGDILFNKSELINLNSESCQLIFTEPTLSNFDNNINSKYVKGLKCTADVNLNRNKVQSFNYKIDENTFVKAKYNKFINVSGKLIPSVVEIDFQSTKTNFKGTFEYSNIQVNQNESFSFVIPKSYSKIKKLIPLLQ